MSKQNLMFYFIITFGYRLSARILLYFQNLERENPSKNLLLRLFLYPSLSLFSTESFEQNNSFYIIFQIMSSIQGCVSRLKCLLQRNILGLLWNLVKKEGVNSKKWTISQRIEPHSFIIYHLLRYLIYQFSTLTCSLHSNISVFLYTLSCPLFVYFFGSGTNLCVLTCTTEIVYK